jgi:hypothetical protein
MISFRRTLVKQQTFFESAPFMERLSESLSLLTHQSSLQQKIFPPFKPPDISQNCLGPPLVTLERSGLTKPMEKIKKERASISSRSSEVIFSLLASAENLKIGQIFPWLIGKWNRKKKKPGFSRNCLGKSEASSSKSISSAMFYPPNWSFEGLNSLLLLIFCCLVCSSFGNKQNQIGYSQGSHHTKKLGNLSRELTGLHLLGLDYHSFIWNSDYRQRGGQMSLGGCFNKIKIGMQVMETVECRALVPATRKKYIAATGLQSYCVWEAANGMSNKEHPKPIKYRIGSLNHSWTNTRNLQVA